MLGGLAERRERAKLARLDHLEGQGDILTEELTIVELAFEGQAPIQLTHQASLVHPPKELDAPQSRAVKDRHRGHRGFDAFARGHDTQRIHHARDAQPHRTAGGARLAGST